MRGSNAWWFGALAASLAVVALGVGWWWLRPVGPLAQLAQAYGQQRTLALRLEEAPHARYDQARSGGGDLTSRPPALLNAAARIRTELDERPADPLWLHARGRLALLDGKPDEAVEALRASRDHAAPTTALELDLATAYYQRALSRGPSGTSDLTLAQELLGQLLARHPSHPAALFNRALVAAELHQLTPAIQDLERLLQVEPDPAWRREAEAKLAEFRRKLRGYLDRTPGEDEERFAEVALDARLREGLWLGPRADSLPALAQRLRDQHQDPWLHDLLALPAKVPYADAVRLLASLADIRLSAKRGRYAQERASAERFEKMALPGPLAAWRDFEFGYRSTHSGGDFPCAVRRGPERYPWLQAQNWRELGGCAVARQQIEQAAQYTTQSRDLAAKSGYAVTAARAEAVLGGLESRQGFYREAMTRERLLLDRIFADRIPVARIHEPVFTIMMAAEALQRHQAARSAAEMAAAVAHAAGLRNPEFNDLAAAADFAQSSGDSAGAERFYRAAVQLYDESKGEAASASARALMELTRAEREPGLSRLVPFASILASTKDPLLSTPYQRLQARELVARGDHAGAQRLLAEAFARLAQPPGANRHLAWRKELDLVAGDRMSALLDRGQSTEAWQVLQELLERQERSLSTAPPRAARLGPTTAFSLRRIANRIVVWRREAPGRLSHRVGPVSPGEVERSVRLLCRQASDPRVTVDAIQATARALTHTLFGDWLSNVPAEQIFLFQAEGFLSAIPFPLLSGREKVIGQERGIALTTGPIRDLAGVAAETTGETLLIDATRIAGLERWDVRPLPPPVEEIAALRRYAGSATVLQGSDASPARLAELLPRASLLHFAGHAVPREGRFGLLLASGVWGFTGGEVPARVVLSACSTGRRHQEEEDTLGAETLAQSFLLAGAAEVVASAWNLDTRAAAVLMEGLYGELRSAGDLGEALRRSVRGVAARTEFAHPCYWAGVMRVVRI